MKLGRVLDQSLVTHLLVMEKVLADVKQLLNVEVDTGFQGLQFAEQLTAQRFLGNSHAFDALHGDLPVDVPALQSLPFLIAVKQMLGPRGVCHGASWSRGVKAVIKSFQPAHHALRDATSVVAAPALPAANFYCVDISETWIVMIAFSGNSFGARRLTHDAELRLHLTTPPITYCRGCTEC